MLGQGTFGGVRVFLFLVSFIPLLLYTVVVDIFLAGAGHVRSGEWHVSAPTARVPHCGALMSHGEQASMWAHNISVRWGGGRVWSGGCSVSHSALRDGLDLGRGPGQWGGRAGGCCVG